jgi:hypothetical protein
MGAILCLRLGRKGLGGALWLEDYSAYDLTTGAAVADHISGTWTDFTASKQVDSAENVPFCVVGFSGNNAGIEFFF